MNPLDAASCAGTCIAIAGVVANNHRRRACFYLWLVSNGLSFTVHAAALAAGEPGMGAM